MRESEVDGIVTLDKIVKAVAGYRNQYGHGICSDVWTYGGYAGYTFMPGDVTGYKIEYDLETGKERHCGLGPGCCWTEWE